VYCQDGRRRASYEHTEFTFLGFTFRQRRSRSKGGKQFNSFNPAISKPALKKISAEVRSWRKQSGPRLTCGVSVPVSGV
jgi:RNA-directed DNA polymerase